MFALGNDIVSPYVSRKAHHPRLLQRVLSGDEYTQYKNHHTARLFLSKAWCAKEASYKALKKLDPTTCFSPAAFVLNEETSCIRYGTIAFQVNFRIHQEYVYCNAYIGAGMLFFCVQRIRDILTSNIAAIRVDETKHDRFKSDESIAVRILAKHLISLHFALPADDIYILKDRHGIPLVFYRKKRMKISISLTHDGKYVGVAVGFVDKLS